MLNIVFSILILHCTVLSCSPRSSKRSLSVILLLTATALATKTPNCFDFTEVRVMQGLGVVIVCVFLTFGYRKVASSSLSRLVAHF